MKFIIFSLLFIFYAYQCKSQITVAPQHRFLTQRLDHTNEQDNRTWQQKLFLVTQYATNHDAPNILGIVDSAKVEPHHAGKGLWNLQAKQLKTNLIVTDLRFFGFNRPTKDLSDDNLKYFTLEQMLGDVEYFIKGINLYLNESDPFHSRNQRWIIQGCGLAGVLAVLARAQFPDLVSGAVGYRAAPLRPSIETPGFFANVVQSFKEESPRCVSNIREGFKEMDAVLRTTSAAQEMGDAYQLCSSLENQTILKKDDVYTLTFLIAHLFAASVKERGDVQDVSPVKDVCRIINDASRGSAFDRLAEAHDLLRRDMRQSCTPLYEDYINRIKDVSYNAQMYEFLSYLRQWKYLQCFEGGVFTTSRNVQDTFYGDCFNLTFLLRVCDDAFPTWTLAKLEENQAKSKALLEKTLPDLTNVAYVHEKSDPYRSIYYYATNPKSSNIEITGTGNCAILDDERFLDPIDVKLARRELQKLLSQWATEK